MEPLLKGHPDERPTPLERSLDNVNLNKTVLISTPEMRPPLLKCHFSGASQEGFHCICICFPPDPLISQAMGRWLKACRTPRCHQTELIYTVASLGVQGYITSS